MGPDYKGTPLPPDQEPRETGTPPSGGSQDKQGRTGDGEKSAVRYVLVRILPPQDRPDTETP